MTVAAKYMKAAGFPSGKYDGHAGDPRWSATTPTRRRRRRRSRSQRSQKLGFKVNFRAVPHETHVLEVLQRAQGRRSTSARTPAGCRTSSTPTLLDADVQRRDIVPENNSNWPQLNDPRSTRARSRRRATASRGRAREGVGRGRQEDHRAGRRDVPVVLGQAAEHRSPRTSQGVHRAVERGVRPVLHVAEVGERERIGARRHARRALRHRLHAMVRYIVRRLLWVVVLLFAGQRGHVRDLLRAAVGRPGARCGPGASPTRELVEQIRHNARARQADLRAVLALHEGPRPALRLRLQLPERRRVREQIVERLPATISLAVGRGRRVAVRRHSRSGSSRRSSAARCSTASPWARPWSRSRRPCTGSGLVSLYLFANDIGKFPLFAGAGTYKPLTRGPVAVVRVADPALVRARRRLRRLLRAPAARPT